LSEKKPTPLVSKAKRENCPVCGKPSYSPAGIHPQCAVSQADAPRKAKLAAEKSAEKEKTKEQPARDRNSAWKKTCPQCQAQVHVRKKTCDCGFSFATS